MSELAIVGLGASESKGGVIVAQAQETVDAGDNPNEAKDVESLGEVDVFSALGHYAVPYPATDAGRAEGISATEVGGLQAAIIAARDTRAGDITGNMQPGDTTIATTHPKSKAQWQCCGELNQVVGYLEDEDGDTMLIQADGKAKTLTLSIPNQMIVMEKGEGVTITTGGATIKATESGEVTIACSKFTLQVGSGVPMALVGTANIAVPIVGVSGGPAVAIPGTGVI